MKSNIRGTVNTPFNRKKQDNAFLAYVSPTRDNFNFDLWASAVKQQMIASLKKRANQ
jgi:hypothetical protein